MPVPDPVPEFRYFDRSNSSTKPEEAEEPQDWRWLRVEEFLRSRELADKTLKAYRRELKLFADWTPKGWHELTVRDCDRYKDYLVNRPSARGGKLSAASVNLALAALQSFLKWMVARDYMAKNPMGLVERPQLEPPRSRELETEEISALERAVELQGENAARDGALLQVLAHGLRASEVVGLDVGDYDGRCLRIRRAKGGSVGEVPLLKSGRGALDRYLSWRVRQGIDVGADAPLFVSRSRDPRYGKRRLSYWGVYRVLEKLAADAGVEGCHPHRLRHSFATRLALEGMSPLLARQLTRHRSEGSYERYGKRALEKVAGERFLELLDG